MKKKSRQHRLNPSKLLVLLLYGTYPYCTVTALDDNRRQLTLEVGPFGRLMRVKNIHILEYLEWLESMNFITITSSDSKTVTIVIDTPLLFRELHA
jgi:hypothetical protein